MARVRRGLEKVFLANYLSFISVDIPYLSTIINNKIKPRPSSIHHGTPKPAGIVPKNNPINPAINAYGI